MRLILCCAALALVACAKSDQPADTAAVTQAAAPAPLTLASLAGQWTAKTMTANSDTAVTNFSFVITGTGTDTLRLPDRPPVVMRSMVSGDSLVSEAGPFSSVLRKNVQVHVVTVQRKQGDNKLVGTVTAHYLGAKKDTVVFRSEATRTP